MKQLSAVTKAPAKLNLRLKFTGRRENGYHELSMLNVPISLCDELRVVIDERSRLELRLDPASSIPLEATGAVESNLVMRAAEAFLSRYPLPLDPSITLLKNIPVGAGLGGGSSDAGAVLRVLSHARRILCPVEEPPVSDELLALAAAIGADIPYFLQPEPALITKDLLAFCIE